MAVHFASLNAPYKSTIQSCVAWFLDFCDSLLLGGMLLFALPVIVRLINSRES